VAQSGRWFPTSLPIQHCYAASRGISRSINRKNRVLRVPDLNLLRKFRWSSIAHKSLRLADYRRAAGPVTLLCGIVGLPRRLQRFE
jgi:hypothetical protein